MSNKITLYDETNLRGNSKQFSSSVPDLANFMFSACARSLKVEGNHWVAYTVKNHKGEFVVYGAGDQVNLDSNMDGKIQSLRLVMEDLKDTNILMYEDANYGGQDRSIERAVDDLTKAGFNNLVSSHQVKRGVWILSDGANYSGRRVITFAGDNWPDYRRYCINDKITSLKPLKSTDLKV